MDESRESTLGACRVCGAPGPHTAYQVREMMFGTREEFDYFQCSDCGCLQIAEVPADLAKYYPPNYYSFSHSFKDSAKFSFRRYLEKQRLRTALFQRGFKFNRLLKPIVPFPPTLQRFGPEIKKLGLRDFKDPIVDVGCGSDSAWLRRFANYHFSNLLGIDPFMPQGGHRDGIAFQKMDIFKFEPEEACAVVAFHHSIEHVPDQLGTLQQARRILRHGGTLLIRIPIVSSEVWERYGTHWVELDAPRHLFLHSTASIVRAAKAAGFELFDTNYDSFSFEFAGSELYMRDVPLFVDGKSSLGPENCYFTKMEMEKFAQEAERVNREKRGGRAAFYFRAV